MRPQARYLPAKVLNGNYDVKKDIDNDICPTDSFDDSKMHVSEIDSSLQKVNSQKSSSTR